ncbi:MAG: HD domain-containing phosphohydrolase [Syntrophomonadaceae bacterium]
MKHILLDQELGGNRLSDPLGSKLDQIILDNLPYAIVSCRLADFSLEYANPATLDLLGYTRNEFLSYNALDLVHPEDIGLVQSFIAANLPIGHGNLEVRYRKKDGAYLWLEVTGTIVPRAHDDTAVIIISHDITDKKQAEAHLRHHLSAQGILLETSKAFNNITVEGIDELIVTALRNICRFDGSERSYVLLFSDDQYTISQVYEWCGEGVPALMQLAKGMPVNSLPWWNKKVQEAEDILIATPSPADSGGDDHAGREALLAAQSQMVVPMFLEERIVGFLGFDAVSEPKTWSKEDTVMLESAAQIIVRALQRKQYVEALQSSENYYRTIFETTGAATMIIEEDMSISMINENCLRLLGYRRGEMIGAPLFDFVPVNRAAALQEYFDLPRTQPGSAPRQYMTQLIDRDHKYRQGAVHVDIIPGTGKYVLTFTDLTEFTRIDRALKTISTINLAMINAEKEADLLRSVCELIVELGGYTLAWVGYLRPEQQYKVQPIANAGIDGGYLAKLNIRLADEKRGKGPTANAIRTCQPIVTPDFKHAESFRPWLKDALRRGFKSSMDIPLVEDGRVFGVINICASEIDAFDDQEQTLLINMADNLAYAIMALRTRGEMNQTARDLEKSLEKMQRILMQSVSALAAALNTRDPYTAVHQKKVVRLASAIAAEIGLSRDQIEGIEVAGNLHDIGKIHVPLEILSKPGKLTDIEFSYVKTHSQSGYDIIKDIEFPWPVANIVLQHHERMDGSGYPLGISGDEILLEARIIAVADVVEAMTSHRPYRPALGIEQALQEIITNQGVLYDPVVVEACCRLFQELEFEWED